MNDFLQILHLYITTVDFKSKNQDVTEVWTCSISPDLPEVVEKQSPS